MSGGGKGKSPTGEMKCELYMLSGAAQTQQMNHNSHTAGVPFHTLSLYEHEASV
jgi:hypothetical protein